MSLYFKASRIQWSRRMRKTMMFLNRSPYPILSQSIQAARKDGGGGGGGGGAGGLGMGLEGRMEIGVILEVGLGWCEKWEEEDHEGNHVPH